jgi:YebC/PmpR family DNA-binding regulatory protein
MAGHSRWAQIKRKKAREDAKKGQIFTKLIREISVASRLGGADPSSNARLRTAMEKARAENMPQDNIIRAIKRGTGELEGVNYEECSYEGYGPGGVAIMVKILTDNKNRTVADIRRIFSRNGGALGEAGCVSWIFERKGLLAVDKKTIDEETLMDVALEAGANDVVDKEDEDVYEVYCAPEDFHKVKNHFESSSLELLREEVAVIPRTFVKLTGREAEQVLNLMEALEEHDDVQNIHANYDIPEEIMEKLSEAS